MNNDGNFVFANFLYNSMIVQQLLEIFKNNLITCNCLKIIPIIEFIDKKAFNL